MTAIACMGGFCPVRQSCRHYHTDTWTPPAERLCTQGTHDCWAPMSWRPEHVAHHHLLAVCQGQSAERATP